MKYGNIPRPLGLSAVCDHIESVCRSAHLYRQGLKLKHLLIPLDSGSGRTTLVEYMADMYRINGVLPFTSSREDFVEVTLDASTPQTLREGINQFRLAADYANAYENIGAMDITDVARHMQEAQLKEFQTGCREICRDACMIFFLPSRPGAGEERLVQKLYDSIGKENCVRLETEAYTGAELAGIMEKTLGEYGIAPEDTAPVRTALTELASHWGITAVPEALAAAEALVARADYSCRPPVLRGEAITEMARSRQKRSDRT